MEYNKRQMEIYKGKTQQILMDYESSLSSKLEKGEDFRIYYKNGGDTVNVLTIIDRDDDSNFLNRIYSTQAKILQRHVLKQEEDGVNVNFRVLPTYNTPISRIIPPSFIRYNAKSQLQKI